MRHVHIPSLKVLVTHQEELLFEGNAWFLLVGGVFTEGLIADWIAYKRSSEVDEIRLRPHPYEFKLYYDI